MYKSLARNLRVLRAERGVPLTEAAQRIGVTRETLGALERGKHGAHTSTLEKIASYYGTTVSALLEEPVQKAKSRLTPEEHAKTVKKLAKPPHPVYVDNPPNKVATVVQSAGEQPLVIWHAPEDEREEVLAMLEERFPEGFNQAEAVGESVGDVQLVTAH